MAKHVLNIVNMGKTNVSDSEVLNEINDMLEMLKMPCYFESVEKVSSLICMSVFFGEPSDSADISVQENCIKPEEDTEFDETDQAKTSDIEVKNNFLNALGLLDKNIHLGQNNVGQEYNEVERDFQNQLDTGAGGNFDTGILSKKH